MGPARTVSFVVSGFVGAALWFSLLLHILRVALSATELTTLPALSP